MSPYLILLRRDLRLAWTEGSAGFNALAFFVLAISLFPLSLGPDPALLARIAGGVVWVAALLAGFLSLDQIFARDHADGSLDLLMAEPLHPAALALTKCLAHWLATVLPLALISPVMALALHLPVEALGRLILGLLLGTPALSLLGGIGAALTVGLRQAGMLLSLLVLPFYIPILIFGAGAIDASLGMDMAWGGLKFLAAISLLGAIGAPFAMAAALRIALE